MESLFARGILPQIEDLLPSPDAGPEAIYVRNVFLDAGNTAAQLIVIMVLWLAVKKRYFSYVLAPH